MLLGLMGQQGDDGRAAADAGRRQPDDRTPRSRASSSRHVISGDTSTDRLAQAFQTLVRDEGEQQRVLAHGERRRRGLAARKHRGLRVGLEQRRGKAADVVFDEPFVSDAYGKELSGARTKAIEVEGVSDDPPERIGAWLEHDCDHRRCAPSTSTLMIDLLRIEQDEDRWRELMKPLVGLIEDLLLVGDFDAARGADRRAGRRRRRRRLDGAPADRADRDRRADRRLDDAARHDPPRDDRRGAVRARQGDVRVARRGAGAAAGRGAVGGGAAAHARAPDRRSCWRSDRSAAGRSNG